MFGDSITTDHISPAGSIAESSPAGRWLQEQGIRKPDFNSYGSRRGNHDVMMRGTFANVRIKNLMLPPLEGGSREEGGMTLFQPSGERMAIYDAAMKYIDQGTDTVIFAGEEYGTGSSRDWAAKGTQLLGGLDGSETVDLDIPPVLKPRQLLKMHIAKADGSQIELKLRCRIDTEVEVAYYRHGGILPYVLRDLLAA